MDIQQAKSVPLAEILQKHGYEPIRSSNKDLWYLSPFRDEKVPSFVVNTAKNVWYDHGEGKGGTVIDLVIRLSGERNVAAVLKIVSGLVEGIVTDVVREIVTGEDRKTERYRSTSDHALFHPALVQYLKSRAISPEFAGRFVREIRYQVGGKEYFGIGFRNESGGYEVRNPYFKGGIGTKDISVVPGTVPAPGIVNVFEGFMNFLSWPLLSGEEIGKEAALVLNSVSLVPRAVAYFKAHPVEEIRLFLDNDEPGRNAEKRLREALPGQRIVDMSDRYLGSKDVNEELVRVRAWKAELDSAIRKEE
jgi:hypothetical protein